VCMRCRRTVTFDTACRSVPIRVSGFVQYPSAITWFFVHALAQASADVAAGYTLPLDVSESVVLFAVNEYTRWPDGQSTIIVIWLEVLATAPDQAHKTNKHHSDTGNSRAVICTGARRLAGTFPIRELTVGRQRRCARCAWALHITTYATGCGQSEMWALTICRSRKCIRLRA
jgi:hypothetical protein